MDLTDKIFLLKSLQKKLNYSFRNVTLLLEAVTDSSCDELQFQPCTVTDIITFNWRHNHRLKILGESVLKFVICEHAVLHLKHPIYTPVTSKVKNVEGKLTKIKESLMTPHVFLLIAEGLGLREYIQVKNKESQRKEKKNSARIMTLFRDTIYALFGAVYIDSTDMKQIGGPETTVKLFFHLWSSFSKIFNVSDFKDKSIKECFPPPTERETRSLFQNFAPSSRDKIYEFWGPDDISHGTLGYRIKSQHIVNEAFTHDSVCHRAELQNIPHYERLEFLGDAVYQLVVCEYLFWHYVNDTEGKFFHPVKLQKFMKIGFQNVLAFHLDLNLLVFKPEQVGISDIGDFFESLIGAIYVDTDRFLDVVKAVLLHVCDQSSSLILDAGLQPLPLNRRTYYGSNIHLFKSHQQDILSQETIRKSALPPVLQDTVKINNRSEFNQMWHRICFGGPIELDECLKHALWLEVSDLNTEIIGETESYCNFLEWERLSLYRVAARMQLFDETRPKEIFLDYSYGNLREVIENRLSMKKEKKNKWRNRFTLTCISFAIVAVSYIWLSNKKSANQNKPGSMHLRDLFIIFAGWG